MNLDQTAFIPLGGVGEFGANSAILKTKNNTILIDFGLMFPPDNRKPGVDYYVVKPDQLLKEFPRIDAIFLTHGHEDHIGGLPHLLPKLDVPIYALAYTARLIAAKCREYQIRPQLVEIEMNQPVRCGDIEVSFIGVTHSIQHACSLAIKTPAGTLIHSGDFKVDPLPNDGHPFQSDTFKAWGEAGVDVLLMDSTNAIKPGFCPSDQTLVPHWEDIIATAKKRVFFTTFSSHIPRLKKLFAIAKRQNRIVACLGRSLNRHLHLAFDTGYLAAQGDLLVSAEVAMKLSPEKVLFVMTGSQGEPRSATARILRKDYRGLTFGAGDTVIFASKAIPGNERQLALLTSEMERLGVVVITARDRPVHASGHAYREELAYLLSLTKPRTVVPIHGEFHHLLRHAQWLKTLLGHDQDLMLIEDGDQIVFDSTGIKMEGRHPIELLAIDGNQNLPVAPAILRDRKDMMYSGLLLVSWLEQDHTQAPFIQVACHGMVVRDQDALFERVLGAIRPLRKEAQISEKDWAIKLRRTARGSLKSFFYGRPLIKCIVNGQIY